MCLTPDLEVCRHDLNLLRHQVLSRASEFPPEHDGDLYCFDPVSRATLESKKRIATIQAQILGDEDPGEAIAYVWVVAERSHPQFGETVPDEMLNDPGTGVAFEQKGVTTLSGEEVFVQRIASSDIDSFKKKNSEDEQDLRLLGVHKDRAGKRKLELNDSLALMKEATMEDSHSPRRSGQPKSFSRQSVMVQAIFNGITLSGNDFQALQMDLRFAMPTASFVRRCGSCIRMTR